MLHHRPDIAVELLLLVVRRLGLVASEHRSDGDVLSGPHKLRGAIGFRNDGLLDLIGARPCATYDITSIRLGVALVMHRRGRWLVSPLLA
jgi:hypothetical protein